MSTNGVINLNGGTCTPPSDLSSKFGKSRDSSSPSDLSGSSAEEHGLPGNVNQSLAYKSGSPSGHHELTLKHLVEPTPPPSGVSSSKSASTASSTGPTVGTISSSTNTATAFKPPIEKMFETFHQSPHGDFKPTFYNPFEVKHRRRTTKSQFATLERAFQDNCRPPVNARRALAMELNMSMRSIQVWFQNRRAKLKNQCRKGGNGDCAYGLNVMGSSDNFILEQEGSQNSSPNSFNGDAEDEDLDAEEHFECNADLDMEDEALEGNESNHLALLTEFRKTRSLPKPQTAAIAITTSMINVPDINMMPSGQAYPNQIRSRSYSLPDIQKSPKLPFKELQDALFGGSASACNANEALSMRPPPQAVQHQRPNVLSSTLPYNQQSQIHASSQYSSQSHHALLNLYQNPYAHHLYESSGGNCEQAPLSLISSNSLSSSLQIDPSRLRPRSRSLAAGQRCPEPTYDYEVGGSSSTNNGMPVYSNASSVLASITENHSLEDYVNGVSSLDLDYFMSSTGGACGLYGHSNTMNGAPMAYSSCTSNSASSGSAASSSPASGSSPSAATSNFLTELSFLPQPSNEILLSTLIDDEHFLGI